MHTVQDRDDAAGIALAITKNFEGDAALYAAFAAACALQFPIDITRGDAACSMGNLAQLGRLAHDLKSVLELLGRTRASELAAHAESHAAAHELVAARHDWRALKELLQDPNE